MSAASEPSDEYEYLDPELEKLKAFCEWQDTRGFSGGQESHTPHSAFETITLPRFVINTIFHAPDDHDYFAPDYSESCSDDASSEFGRKFYSCVDSDDKFDADNETSYDDALGIESSSSDITFTAEDFNEPPFYLEPDNTLQAITIDDDNSSPARCVDSISSFLKLLKESAFSDAEKDKLLSAIYVSMLVNRRASISWRRNTIMFRKQNVDEIQQATGITVKIETCLWLRGTWKVIKDRKWGKHKSSEDPTFNQVQNFYEKLKFRDTNAAKRFISANEDLSTRIAGAEKKLVEIELKQKKLDKDDLKRQKKYIGNLTRLKEVPFRALREHLKNSTNTKTLVKAAMRLTSHVYLSLIDKDTLDFNRIFSSYHELYQNSCTGAPGRMYRGPPQVMSTGYVYGLPNTSKPDEKLIARPVIIGSLVDRAVRAAIASKLQDGVYYPEPNTCILIQNGDDTLKQSFEPRDQNQCLYRNQSLESPTLLKYVRRDKGRWIFTADYPALITSLPKRAYKNRGRPNGEKTDINFSEDSRQATKKLNEADFRLLAQMAQSHLHPWLLPFYLKINNGAPSTHPYCSLAKIFTDKLEEPLKWDPEIENCLTEDAVNGLNEAKATVRYFQGIFVAKRFEDLDSKVAEWMAIKP